MFTGIIEEVGSLEIVKRANGGSELQIRCSKVISEIKPGDSLAVNGICFTILDVKRNMLKVFASVETLEKTTVPYWLPGEYVNMERALRFDGRLDGHLVLGHIDFVGQATDIRKVGTSRIIRIEYPQQMGKYFVLKGSVGLDGISLTISSLGQRYFENTIIPFTWENTNLKKLSSGKRVNIEADIIGKYVESLLNKKNLLGQSGITQEYLKQQGYKFPQEMKD